MLDRAVPAVHVCETLSKSLSFSVPFLQNETLHSPRDLSQAQPLHFNMPHEDRDLTILKISSIVVKFISNKMYSCKCTF